MTGVGMVAVGAIEAHNVVVLVLRPDSSHKPPIPAVLSGLDIDHQAANLSEKLAPHVGKAVGLAVKIAVQQDHLGKSRRPKPQRVEFAELRKDVKSGHRRELPGCLVGKPILEIPRQVQSAQKVTVADWDRAGSVIVLEVLNVSFDQRV
jgi:hypothetical protein